MLGDFESEKEAIYMHNPWLKYTLSLHRCRELGYHHPLFGLLDQKRFTTEELCELCSVLFGEDAFDSVEEAEWLFLILVIDFFR